MDSDLTIKDLIELTGYSGAVLRRMCRAGTMPGAYRLGRKWLVAREVWDKRAEKRGR